MSSYAHLETPSVGSASWPSYFFSSSSIVNTNVSSLLQQKALLGALICIGANTLVSLALNVQKKAHQQAEQQSSEDEDGDRQEERRWGRGDGEAERFVQQARTNYGSTGIRSSSSNSNSKKKPSRPPMPNGSPIEEDETGPYSIDDSSASGPSHQRTPSGNGGPNAKFLSSRLWWLGLLLMTLGEAGNFISYGFAPASLVAPLGSVALLANVFIAPVMLKERFATSDLLGVLLASAGAAGVVASAATDGGGGGELDGTPDALWGAMTQLVFEVYAAVMAVLGVLLLWMSSTSLGDRYILVDVGACAVFGGFTVLSTKGVSSLISHAAGGGDIGEVLRSPITYGLLVVLVGTALTQIAMLNRALQRFDARSVIPSQFVFFTISAISGSAVLFRDFERASVGRVLGFVAGCLTTFGGVYVLTRRKEGEGDGGDESSEGSSSGRSGKKAGRQGGHRVSASASSGLVIVDEERQALLPVAPTKSKDPRSPPFGPIPEMSSGSTAAATRSHSLASSSAATSAATPRPVLSSTRSGKTPRLSFVGGGAALGGGGYLLLASPNSSRGAGAALAGAGQAQLRNRVVTGPTSYETSPAAAKGRAGAVRGSKSADTWLPRKSDEQSSGRDEGQGGQTGASSSSTRPSAPRTISSSPERITDEEQARRRRAERDEREVSMPAMPLNLPTNFGSTNNSATPPGAGGTEGSFRSQLSGFRWAQGANDDSRASAQQSSTGGSSLLPSWMSNRASSSASPSSNAGPPGAGASSWLSSYVPLRSNSRPDSEEALLSLSHWERLLSFLACLAGSGVCFLFSFLFLLSPLPKLRKFALSFSLGSMLFMVGFAVLVGPLNHLRHMCSKERLPFSVAYVGSLALTLYFALGPRVTLPTLGAGIVQVGALLAYLAAYFPGGTTTLRYAGQWAARGAAGWLPL